MIAGMMKKRHIAKRHCLLFTLVAAFLCSLAIADAFGALSNFRNSSIAAAAVKTERAIITVEGMSCANCAKGIKAMLKRTPGVITVEVSFERREAVVDYDADQTSREKIVEAINKLGYKASVKQ